METNPLKIKMKYCAELLYQNREQEAYEILKELIVPLNEMLQKLAGMAVQSELGNILKIIEEFLNAYQVKDHLALADSLYYRIPGKAEEMGIWNG